MRHGLKVSHGKVQNWRIFKRFLASFRGQRYHLNKWRQGYQLSTPGKFLKMKHASARLPSNVIDDDESNIVNIHPSDAWNTWRMELANQMFYE
ncbi:hypothetical protein Godav_023322 [Gossypium davidsonii]|uniref:Uncharacterized protein n=1 Tax=Gossypium davidsonii TaxID=34287 RepID=A0A7J8SR98_GOSDV|nr:hypothetical protein [Gossypium davidsonii]